MKNLILLALILSGNVLALECQNEIKKFDLCGKIYSQSNGEVQDFNASESLKEILTLKGEEYNISEIDKQISLLTCNENGVRANVSCLNYKNLKKPKSLTQNFLEDLF